VGGSKTFPEHQQPLSMVFVNDLPFMDRLIDKIKGEDRKSLSLERLLFLERFCCNPLI